MSDVSKAAIATFRAALEQAPLGVFRNAEQGYAMIPASLHPLVLPDHQWSELQHDAGLVLSALEKVSASLRQNSQSSLLVNLAPLEKEPADFGGLATARLDLFFDGDDLIVIEANTTIPAMQAYSDMIKSAYLQAFLPSKMIKKPTNTQDLLTALLQHYERTGGRKPKPTIGIVARAGDSQFAELQWLQKKWQEQGHETLVVTPDALVIKQGQLYALNIPLDLVYRHIFAHRLPRASAFAEACLHADRYRVFNPIAAHLEAKSTLAELSRQAADPRLSQALALHDDEIKATLRRVVWSRILKRQETSGPDGSRISDLITWVQAHSNDLVVKSSLGYGGHGVFMGSSFHERETQERAQKFLGASEPLSWSDFIEHLVQTGPDQWIVQKKVSGRKMQNRFLVNGQVVEQETYVDCSIFTSSGISFRPSGGACRFSSDAIVNIGQGGGLMALLLESEL
ncbi:MAG TPA: hypothetical protein VE954_12095 [Oligoflexus sp.]|uniref:hypothetical protein n=1 Tax=Oligoflexus sp. TaxID=1971216 RepID=UPI002D4952B5|nr:hypothetical protein [Oligoflexus sp.]HYX33847.1 hypothetical protein [Oligoflexus sp.]